jgi:predicted nucleic acid-binding protein
LVSFLVDTNVLLYAYDPRDRSKQEQAQVCLERLAITRLGALSAQVLGEFFWVATRRLDPPLSVQEAERSLANYARSWPVYDITSTEVLEAVRAVQRYKFAYWDALVWATAKLWEVPNVLTEDKPSSELLEGVRFVNPFEPGFAIAALK